LILLNLSSVDKSFGDAVVLQDVDLTLQKGDRVGLVGANGSGKSTLLRIMAAEWTADSGLIDKPRDVTVGYLPQSARVSGTLPLYAEMERVFEHADPNEPYDYRIRRALHGVGLDESKWDLSTQSLSGGEKCRAALARLLLTGPDVLLLDEPTNHLDLAGREWLESYLARFDGAVVIVAHDRVLLNRSTNRTAFLLAKTLKAFKGGFESSRAQWEAERERTQREFERQREFIDRTQDFIRRNIAGQKTKQAQSRRKMLARLDRVEKPQAQERGPKVGWEHAGRSRAELFRLDRCALGYDKEVLVRINSLAVRRGERIGIVGPNGCGKSTLLRTLLKNIEPIAGVLTCAESTRVSYFRQEVEQPPFDITVEEHFWNLVPDWQIGQVRSYLARFLFRRDEVEKSVRGLSGGERRRLELARLTVDPAHVLILDEPTNHLDLMAQDAVADALRGFEGALLLVSHDRWLLDATCEKLWVFEEGHVREFLGNYTEYVRRRTEQAQQAPAEPKRDPRAAAKEARRERQRVERTITEAESTIARLERELHALDAEGRDPATASNWERLTFLTTEKRKKQRELNRVMAEWEQASNLADRLSRG